MAHQLATNPSEQVGQASLMDGDSKEISKSLGCSSPDRKKCKKEFKEQEQLGTMPILAQTDDNPGQTSNEDERKISATELELGATAETTTTSSGNERQVVELNTATAITDFVVYTETFAEEMRKEYMKRANATTAPSTLFISPEDERGFGLFWTSSRCESFAKFLQFHSEGQSVVIEVKWKERRKKFHHFDKEAIDCFVGDLGDLQQKLDETAWPLEVGKFLKPDVRLVSTVPENPRECFPLDGHQQDPEQSFAVVVAGESGSGKSVFSCKMAKDLGFETLYMCLESRDMHKRVSEESLPLADIPQLLQSAIAEANETPEEMDHLYALKKAFNRTRDEWAFQILESKVRNTIAWFDDSVRRSKYSAKFGKWAYRGIGWQERCKPKKLALILDQVEMDLAEGLISEATRIHEHFAYLAREQVLLILVGVGLDAIKEGDWTTTNPKWSRLVVMKSPIIEALRNGDYLGEHKHAICAALERGIYARPLGTNARMLFHAVLPELQSSRHYEGHEELLKYHFAAEQILQDRLIEIASYGHIMDYAARFYVVRARRSSEEWSTLFSQAFGYHLVQSMEKVLLTRECTARANNDHELTLVHRMFLDHNKIQNDPTADIFRCGVACRSGTSAAVKYLSGQFRLPCHFRIGFEEVFEEMVGLHLMRYMQVQDCTVDQLILRYAWLPMVQMLQDEEIEGLEDVVLKYQVEMERLEELSRLVSVNRKTFVVFPQPQRRAAEGGGPVLALLVDPEERKASVEAICCMHRLNPPAPAEWCEWWACLGVELDASGQTNMSPDKGPAGDYYKRLCGFRDLVGKRLKQLEGFSDLTVVMGKRTLAASFPTPTGSDLPFPHSDPSGQCRAWFREHLEPTISVFPPKQLVDNSKAKPKRKRDNTGNNQAESSTNPDLMELEH